MMSGYLVTSATRLHIAASKQYVPAVEAAPRVDEGILGKGSYAVWIVDREGNLILPMDQIRLGLLASAVFAISEPQD